MVANMLQKGNMSPQGCDARSACFAMPVYDDLTKQSPEESKYAGRS